MTHGNGGGRDATRGARRRSRASAVGTRTVRVAAVLLVATTLPTTALRAQARFGELQYAPPKGTRAESPAALVVTDSSSASLCRYGILPAARASADPRADHRAAHAEVLRVLGGTGEPARGLVESALASGHVQRIGESTMQGADGQRRTLRVLTITGAGTRATTFVQHSSFLRCLLRVSAFESSLVPLWPAGGATVATGAAPATGAPPTRVAAATTTPASPAPAAPSRAVEPPPPPAPAGGAIGTRGWAFTETRFDDGWTATIADEWVVVRKGDLVARLHHPREDLDKYMGSTRDEVVRAWDALVVPRYRDIADFVVEYPGMTHPARAYGWARAIDAATGRPAFVVMAKLNEKGRRFIEVTAPDQATFEREFGSFAEGRVNWDGVLALQWMNRFAVAPSDLAGEWSDRFAATYDVHNALTGSYQGAYTTGYSTRFVVTGNRYHYTIAGGEGMLGSMRVGKQEDAGPISVPDGWSIRLGNRAAGRQELYWARFESVRGGRILVMGTPGDDFPSLRMVKVR